MTDHFSILNEPRRPWLDADSLKQKFLVLSTEVHPDRVHSASPAEKEAAQQRYTALNTAYNTLREPKERLRHLLELELGAKPKDIQSIPADLMDLFLEVSQLCRQTDSFLAEKRSATSPLVQVQMFERGQDWTEQLMALQTRLNSLCEGLESELKTIDADWTAVEKPAAVARRATLHRLEEMYRLFSYYARWGSQIQERIVQLAF
jgi:curved DNA-binding protein CbpA